MTDLPPWSASELPPGVRSRFVDGVNGLRMHILESGFESAPRPCVLLLHGFPELAYSWRKTMPALAAAGYHVIAPDQRGYGRTTGWDPDYDGDLPSFRMLNLARDAFGLVRSLGYESVACVAGHDFGSPVAAWCALLRPDVFRSAVFMSAPWAGPPELPLGQRAQTGTQRPDIHEALAALPRPRKHYQWYYSTREANANMWRCPQGVHDFLRAYYHYKSADWRENTPYRLQAWTANELAKLPTYYVMDLGQGMAETVAPYLPSAEAIRACAWLTDAELRVYSTEYERTGFQGGFQWYRCMSDPRYLSESQLFAGRAIEVPSLYIAGSSDWGVYQTPGAFEKMQSAACRRLLGCHLLAGAGHWVQQEQPEAVNRLLLAFLQAQASPG